MAGRGGGRGAPRPALLSARSGDSISVTPRALRAPPIRSRHLRVKVCLLSEHTLAVLETNSHARPGRDDPPDRPRAEHGEHEASKRSTASTRSRSNGAEARQRADAGERRRHGNPKLCCEVHTQLGESGKQGWGLGH